MASVQLKGIHKRYDGDVHVVKGIDLSVEDGEFLVLVGPSGCGKSTTLRMIAGLEEISDGELKIGDVRVNDVAPKDRDIGMVFQSYALYPHMTVRENIAFGLVLRKMPAAEIDARVQEVAGTLQLTELLDRKPGQLSGGQRQRVAMGRALARRPQVFLFDEPLSNLDAALRVEMRTELASLHQRLGTTMVYVTHDQVEAMTLATRIAVLHQGVLQQVGSPLELYENPANTFVARFIGSPAMNLLEGELDWVEDQAFFVAERLRLPIGSHKVKGLEKRTPIQVGIRPHDVDTQHTNLEGVVDVVERMGWEAFAHVGVGPHTFIVRLEGTKAAAIKSQTLIELSLPQRSLHVFDAEGVSLVGDQDGQ
jgi:multiple sugar transport system ATP-binding protein